MIREAMEWIKVQGNRRYTIGTREFLIADENIVEIKTPTAISFNIATLSGLVDYLNSDFDTDQNKKLSVVVEKHNRVKVMSNLNENADRDSYVKVDAELPEITLNSYMNLEEFNVQMQAVFVETEERAKVLQFIGNIRSESVKNQSDNGITQTVEVRQGVATVEKMNVPNPVHLKPYRTFTEIIQPESAFVLRLREGRDGIQAALFEADGGAWRNEARASIAKYLKDNVIRTNVTILS